MPSMPPFEDDYIERYDDTEVDDLQVTYYEVTLLKGIGKYGAGDYVDMLEIDYNNGTIVISNDDEEGVYTVRFRIEIDPNSIPDDGEEI